MEENLNQEECEEKKDRTEETEDEIKDEIEDEVEASTEEVDEKDQQIEDLKNSLTRIQADFINFKNRTQKEKSQSIALANEGLILRLLPIVDDLDRALQQKTENNEFSKGIEMIAGNLMETLKNEGLEEVPSVGEEFDPNFHHAVIMEESKDIKPNHIIETLQKGYTLNDKVIRPSMVKVSE